MEISISSPSSRSSASTTTAGRRTAKLLPHLETCIKDIPSLLYIYTSLEARFLPSAQLRRCQLPFHILTPAAEGGHQAESGPNGTSPAPSKNPPLAHQPKRTLVIGVFHTLNQRHAQLYY